MRQLVSEEQRCRRGVHETFPDPFAKTSADTQIFPRWFSSGTSLHQSSYQRVVIDDDIDDDDVDDSDDDDGW